MSKPAFTMEMAEEMVKKTTPIIDNWDGLN
jgi:hypothetical protein